MKIEKLPSGSYRVRKMYKGIQYTVITDYKPTQKEALKLISAEMDKAVTVKNHMTFEDAAKEYNRVKSNVLSPATIRGYNTIIRNLSDDFKHMLVSDITALVVQAEVNRYSENRKAKSVRNMHGFVNAVLGLFAPNTILNTTLPKRIEEEPYVPSDDDVSAVLKESAGTPFEVPLILATFGLRRSEICALTLNDVGKGTIEINKAKVQDSAGNWVIKNLTKTEAGRRTIKVPVELTDKIHKQGYVYKGFPNSILVYLERTQQKLGIPKFTLHRLRHYYASTAHSLGIPDAYIMRLGGWKSDHVLINVYRHAMDDKLDEMADFAEEYISTLMK